MNGQHDDSMRVQIHLHLDGVDKVIEALKPISQHDLELLAALERRAERIARKLERLDAKTPRQ